MPVGFGVPSRGQPRALIPKRIVELAELASDDIRPALPCAWAQVPRDKQHPLRRIWIFAWRKHFATPHAILPPGLRVDNEGFIGANVVMIVSCGGAY